MNVSSVPKEPIKFELSRHKHHVHNDDGTINEENQWRCDNAKLIQETRWQWVKDNPHDFVNLMRHMEFTDESIQAMIDRDRPLDFKSRADFEECTNDLSDCAAKIKERTGITNMRFIQQGSSITGYSSNPRKGERFTPNYLYAPN